MMKPRLNCYKGLSIVLIYLSLVSVGYADTPSASDEYATPSPGATSPEEIVKQVEASVGCVDPLCTLFSATVNKKTFTISSYAGMGNMMQNGGTGNNYYGYSPNQNGTNGSNGNNGSLNYGVQVSWDNTRCVKNVNVDKSVYEAVTTYMRELVNRTPGENPTYPQFTPAEETMILFYTTVMELTKGSTCN